MTEEEAKTKACCAGLGFGHHSQPTMPQGVACIGSTCMAWRWLIHPDFASGADNPSGYCGLAGGKHV